jgi:hypothetical protein
MFKDKHAHSGVKASARIFPSAAAQISAPAHALTFEPARRTMPPMSFLNLAFIERLAEERIKKAQDEGAFDALPGRGKPLNLDDDAHVPEDLRLAWRVLKNADCLPPEILAQREIHTARELLASLTDEAERYRQMQRLNLMITRLNESRRRPVSLETRQEYYEAIVARVPTAGKRRNHPPEMPPQATANDSQQ